MRAAEDMIVLRPKSKGSGIMVSDFIDQHSVFLRLSEDELALVNASSKNRESNIFQSLELHNRMESFI